MGNRGTRKINEDADVRKELLKVKWGFIDVFVLEDFVEKWGLFFWFKKFIERFNLDNGDFFFWWEGRYYNN